MDIKLEQYRIFKVCAETGSFSEAAKKLFITQSAVSQQIQKLESEIGTPLFLRRHKGVGLTNQGRLLLGYIEQSLSIIENAEGLFERMLKLEEGELRIGAGDTITKYFLLPILEQYHKEYPAIKIEITNRVTTETLFKLQSGKVDIAFVNMPIDISKFSEIEATPAKTLHDIFVAGRDFLHLNDRQLSESDVASLPLVMLEPKSNSRMAVDRYFLSKGITLRPEFELGSHELLPQFAANGLGIACVTREFVADSLKSGEIFELKTSFSLPERSVGVCTLRGVAHSPAVSKLLEMI